MLSTIDRMISRWGSTSHSFVATSSENRCYRDVSLNGFVRYRLIVSSSCSQIGNWSRNVSNRNWVIWLDHVRLMHRSSSSVVVRSPFHFWQLSIFKTCEMTCRWCSCEIKEVFHSSIFAHCFEFLLKLISLTIIMSKIQLARAHYDTISV